MRRTTLASHGGVQVVHETARGMGRIDGPLRVSPLSLCRRPVASGMAASNCAEASLRSGAAKLLAPVVWKRRGNN
jgi:hypothetical protein